MDVYHCRECKMEIAPRSDFVFVGGDWSPVSCMHFECYLRYMNLQVCLIQPNKK